MIIRIRRRNRLLYVQGMTPCWGPCKPEKSYPTAISYGFYIISRRIQFSCPLNLFTKFNSNRIVGSELDRKIKYLTQSKTKLTWVIKRIAPQKLERGVRFFNAMGIRSSAILFGVEWEIYWHFQMHYALMYQVSQSYRYVCSILVKVW